MRERARPTRAGRRRSPPTHLSDDGTNDLLELPGVSKLHELAVAVVRGVCVLEEQDRDLEIDLPGCPIVCMRSQLQPPTSGARDRAAPGCPRRFAAILPPLDHRAGTSERLSYGLPAAATPIVPPSEVASRTASRRSLADPDRLRRLGLAPAHVRDDSGERVRAPALAARPPGHLVETGDVPGGHGRSGGFRRRSRPTRLDVVVRDDEELLAGGEAPALSRG